MDNGAMDWKERRRALAFQLRAEGWQQRRIAQILGVTDGAVSQWFSAGKESIPARKPTGRPPRLDEEQKAELARILSERPNLSRAEIAEILWERWGVRYHPSHISRLRQQLQGCYTD